MKITTAILNSRVALLAIAAMLLLAQNANAGALNPTCPDYSFSAISSAYQNDLPLMLIAILVSFAIAALFFLIGILLRNDRIRNFGIGELYEAVASALIVVFFLYLANAILVSIPQSLGVANPYLQVCYGITTVISSAQTSFTNMYDVNQFVFSGGYLWNTYQLSKYVIFDKPATFLWFPPPPPGVPRFKLTPSIDYKLNLADIGAGLPIYAFTVLPIATIANFLVDGVYILWAEFYLMGFFAVVAPVMFAAGVIFRALFPTRGFGGVLMATGMAFYLVMPTLFSFALLQTCQYSCAQPSTLPTQFQSLNDYISNFWLIILFYPPLIIALTYSFITQVSNFLGQATSVGGRLRGFI